MRLPKGYHLEHYVESFVINVFETKVNLIRATLLRKPNGFWTASIDDDAPRTWIAHALIHLNAGGSAQTLLEASKND